MKTIVKFEFEDELEMKQQLLPMLKATDMAAVLWELKHNFWRKWKYDEEKLDLDSLQEAINRLFLNFDIDIDNLQG